MVLPVLNFKEWIEENRHLLKPPVGNREVFPGSDFIVMVVGGPNARKDFHIDPGPELFYQIEGDITVKIIEDNQVKDIRIKEGEMFMLPSFVPHSPQRGANTVGLVIERKRNPDETDAIRWYCEKCNSVLHQADFPLEDIVAQLKTAMESYWSDEEIRTCKQCGTVMQPPAPVA